VCGTGETRECIHFGDTETTSCTRAQASECNTNAYCVAISDTTHVCICNAGFVGDGRAKCVQSPTGDDSNGGEHTHYARTHCTVTCLTDGITLRLRERQPFDGHIYVKGQSNNGECSRSYTIADHPQNEYEFTVTFKSCDIRRPSPVGSVRARTTIVAHTGDMVRDDHRATSSVLHHKTVDRIQSPLHLPGRLALTADTL
jgi:hypothetical protein